MPPLAPPYRRARTPQVQTWQFSWQRRRLLVALQMALWLPKGAGMSMQGESRGEEKRKCVPQHAGNGGPGWQVSARNLTPRRLRGALSRPLEKVSARASTRQGAERPARAALRGAGLGQRRVSQAHVLIARGMLSDTGLQGSGRFRRCWQPGVAVAPAAGGLQHRRRRCWQSRAGSPAQCQVRCTEFQAGEPVGEREAQVERPGLCVCACGWGGVVGGGAIPGEPCELRAWQMHATGVPGGLQTCV